MKYFYHAIRIFTGFLFLAIFFSKFGLLPSAVTMPDMFTLEGFAFIQAIQANGYLFPTIGIVSLVSGLTFLFNRYVALGALLMIPITLNFALFHVFLGLPLNTVFMFFREIVAFVFFALNLYMLYSARDRYTKLLKP